MNSRLSKKMMVGCRSETNQSCRRVEARAGRLDRRLESRLLTVASRSRRIWSGDLNIWRWILLFLSVHKDCRSARLEEQVVSGFRSRVTKIADPRDWKPPSDHSVLGSKQKANTRNGIESSSSERERQL